MVKIMKIGLILFSQNWMVNHLSKKKKSLLLNKKGSIYFLEFYRLEVIPKNSSYISSSIVNLLCCLIIPKVLSSSLNNSHK